METIIDVASDFWDEAKLLSMALHFEQLPCTAFLPVVCGDVAEPHRSKSWPANEVSVKTR